MVVRLERSRLDQGPTRRRGGPALVGRQAHDSSAHPACCPEVSSRTDVDADADGRFQIDRPDTGHRERRRRRRRSPGPNVSARQRAASCSTSSSSTPGKSATWAM